MKNGLFLLENGDMVQGKILHDMDTFYYLSNVVVYHQNGAYTIENRNCYVLSKKKLKKNVELSEDM